MILISDEMIRKAAFEVDQAILDMFPDDGEYDHVFSPSFERKMERLIRKEKHFTAYRFLKRVACVFIAFLLAASMTVASNSKVRAAVLDWVEEHFGQFYHYFFVGEDVNRGIDETGEIGETGATEDVGATEGTTVPIGLPEYSLGWVPEGYSQVDMFSVQDGVTCIYLSDSMQMIQFTYVYGDDGQEVFTGVGEYEQKFIANGNLYAELLLALDSSDSNVITWVSDNGMVRFAITGFLDEATLIKMAQGLVVK